MEINQIITLIQTVSDSNLTGFSLEEGNMKLRLEKYPQAVKISEACGMTLQPESQITEGEQATQEAVSLQPEIVTKADRTGQDASADLKGEVLKSPLVGTFYRSSSPETEPFVRAGDQVKKGQVLGIIEAMKLMNEIEAEKDGIVEAVLVENEQMVEYGQPLFSII